MKTSEPKTASVAKSTKANQPFFSKDGEGSFFGEKINQEASFFKPSSAYCINGNRVLQTKPASPAGRLTIGQHNDKYEKEADAMADKVVQRLASSEPLTKKEASIQTKPLAQTIAPLVQAKCADCESASAKASAGKEEKLQTKEDEDLDQESPLELQRKPIFESNAEPPDDNSLSFVEDPDHFGREGRGEAIQRKCADCEKEEKVQKKSDSSDSPLASPSIESSLHASKGSGSPIPESTKQQMENSFGANFSNVRLHTDSSAVQMNKDLHAQAFTHGSDIYFNAGKYDTNSTGGKHLLAHELTHVVQQGGGVHKKIIQRNCGAEGIGKPEGCEKMAGDLKGPRYLFNVDCDTFARGNDIDLERDALMIQDNSSIEIHGFASSEGDSDYNHNLSCARAIAAKKLVESVLTKQRVTANIKIFSHGPQSGNRTVMRGVTVLINNPAPRINTACPPPKDFQAVTLNDYVDLIKCVESSTALSNRQVLALLRQMYYGKDWSATSTTNLWDNVITCNVNPGDPRKLLHADLFAALHRSVDVQGTDIGHVFTGLESMMCPSARVKVNDTFLVSDMLDDIANVEMSNEQFATWGGDLGAAVAAMASCWFMDENERKKSKDCEGADLMKGLLGFLEIHAPDTDLEGDVVSFVIRANATGIPCSGSMGQTLNLSAPISALFTKYLADKKSGSGHIDRYKCFADIIGANITNGQIQNKDELVRKLYDPVLEFAKTYYVKIMVDVHGKIPPHRVVPFGTSMQSMMRNTPFAIRYFLSWIERKMNGSP